MTTSRKQSLRLLPLLSLLGVSACLLTVDLEPLSDERCPTEEKFCGSECASKRSPKTGCANTSCAPCALAHATSNCASNGLCAIAGCLESYQDCNRVSEDGCEVDIDHDPLHCGGCNADACLVANGTPDCASGRCAIRSCKSGFDDCNDDAEDGCETSLKTDKGHCGTCEVTCSAAETCQGGECI